jgi:hypothetical protein
MPRPLEQYKYTIQVKDLGAIQFRKGLSFAEF